MRGLKKLRIDGDVIPDLLVLQNSWINEENGVPKWASTYCNDVIDYSEILGLAFLNQLDQSYKLGKAYHFFSDNFVRKIFYHNISEN